MVLYRVTYVDTIVREAFVEAHDEYEALDVINAEIGDGAHHHALDAYQEDMQATPTLDRDRQRCFECGH